MNKIALLTDSSSNISKITAVKYNIHILDMPININDVEYLSNKISLDEVTTMMRTGAVCKTSQPITGYVYKMYHDLLNEYDEIIHLPMSSKLSVTYNSSYSIAKEFDGKITVLQSIHF